MASVGGLSCWPWGDRDACRRTIEQGEREGNETFMARAGREGWRIGHADGQAYYVCPDHKDAVWDAIRLWGMQTHIPFRPAAIGPRKRPRPRNHPHRGPFYPFKHTRAAGFRFLNARFRASWVERRAAKVAREK